MSLKNQMYALRNAKIILLIASVLMLVSISVSTLSSESREFVRPDLIPVIEEISEEYGISPELVEAMIETESCGISTVSNGRCYGLMQVSTRWHADRAARLGVDMTTDAGNIRTGVDYLMEIAEDSDDLYYVLATYNGQSEAAEGRTNGYASKILDRAYELETVHGKHQYELSD